MTLQSSLSRFQKRAPTAAAELNALRRAAWHQQGVAVLTVADIADDWLRQALTNEANRLYGQRQEASR